MKTVVILGEAEIAQAVADFIANKRGKPTRVDVQINIHTKTTGIFEASKSYVEATAEVHE